jgi:N-acetylglucosamine kinase-like BadF-type ATPase
MPASILGHHRYTCGNDMVCGWAGSLACGDGINIISGTGSIGYGECQDRTARSGGWGETFGDEGSAYWIAVQGLNLFSRMSDGRRAKGPLYKVIRDAFRLENDLDLSGLLTGVENAGRTDIAVVSKLVAKAAELGDIQSVDIFRSAANELALIVDAVGQALSFDSQQIVPVSYSGGVFESGGIILEPLRQALEKSSQRYALTKPKFPPNMGAAMYAQKLSQRK